MNLCLLFSFVKREGEGERERERGERERESERASESEFLLYAIAKCFDDCLRFLAMSGFNFPV